MPATGELLRSALTISLSGFDDRSVEADIDDIDPEHPAVAEKPDMSISSPLVTRSVGRPKKNSGSP